MRIHGLSARASLVIHRVEYLSGGIHLEPGATDRALPRATMPASRKRSGAAWARAER